MTDMGVTETVTHGARRLAIGRYLTPATRQVGGRTRSLALLLWRHRSGSPSPRLRPSRPSGLRCVSARFRGRWCPPKRHSTRADHAGQARAGDIQDSGAGAARLCLPGSGVSYGMVRPSRPIPGVVGAPWYRSHDANDSNRRVHLLPACRRRYWPQGNRSSACRHRHPRRDRGYGTLGGLRRGGNARRSKLPPRSLATDRR